MPAPVRALFIPSALNLIDPFLFLDPINTLQAFEI
jgi:hypothetical protein